MPQLDPQIGEFYRYYQGGTVQILSLATHTETGEPLVVYQDLFGRYDTWATPRSRFVGEVDFAKHPTCPDRFRYTFLPQSELHRPEGVRAHSRDSEEGRAAEPERKADREQQGEARGREPEKSLSDLMLAFLDERDFEKKDEILAEMAIRPDLNDGLIDNLAAALDVVIDEGSVDRRFSQLRVCVRTRARFENSRLR